MKWEYLFVEFHPINTVYHLYKINDMPQKAGGSFSRRSDFCKQLGMDGWEMVNYSYEVADRSLAVFKRPLVQNGLPSWPQAQGQMQDRK